MSVLKIDLTYQCTAACEHCRFRSSREPSQVLDPELAARCMCDLKEANDLRLVVLLGGEPGLYPREMLSILTQAHSLGLDTRLETNAFWATDDDEAARFLKPLAALGTQVAVSIDSFHDAFVPLESIVTAIRTCELLGLDCWVDTTFLDNDRRDQPEDLHTIELIHQAEEMLGHPIRGHYQGPAFFTGRSTDRLAKRLAPGRGIPNGPCTQAPWWMDGRLERTDLLNLDPDGYLSKGCGIAIGNLMEQSAAVIVSTFDPHRHPVFRMLLDKGPLGLAEEASEFGFELESDYADRCHLCQEAREFLREKYSEYLVPARHYREVTSDR